MRSLKKTLDKLYDKFDFKERIMHDPIEFPHGYADPGDIETAGFISACFAYGKVDQFKPVIARILAPAGEHPSDFFLNFSLKKDSRYFKGINYRFNKERDVLCFIYLISRVLKKWGSLKNLFYYYFDDNHHDDIKLSLTGFIRNFLNIDTSPVYGKNIKPTGLTQLIPSPEKGSACKRMNLFLRWMVRKNDIDFGIWDNVSPSKLIIPLDTHIARISRCIGLTKRTASDWKTAKDITEALKDLDPEDPLRYDFALCHQGIAGKCKGRDNMEICSYCALNR